ncbi:hypothetical protein Trydic_g1924 [Trypoxylus dichotomus]
MFQLTFPGHYASSCTGHPLADIPGEEQDEDALGVKIAAQRRLHYELGIKPEQIPVNDIFYLTRIYHCDRGNGKWGDHAIVYILIVQQDFTLKANSNELSELSFIPQGQFYEHLRELKVPLEPILNLVLTRNMLNLWWKNLDDLNSIKNHNDVIRLDEKCNEFMK